MVTANRLEVQALLMGVDFASASRQPRRLRLWAERGGMSETPPEIDQGRMKLIAVLLTLFTALLAALRSPAALRPAPPTPRQRDLPVSQTRAAAGSGIQFASEMRFAEIREWAQIGQNAHPAAAPELGQKFRALRGHLALSRGDTAARLGCAESLILVIENGYANADLCAEWLTRLERLASEPA